MKKNYLKSVILGIITSSLLISPVFAVINPPPDTVEFPNVDIWTIINKVVSWFLAFVILAAVIMIIVAGYEYVTAGGDSKKLQIALNRIIYALVGIGVALLTKVLIMAICNFVSSNACSFFQI